MTELLRAVKATERALTLGELAKTGGKAGETAWRLGIGLNTPTMETLVTFPYTLNSLLIP